MDSDLITIIGIPPLINASGTLTELGGCRMIPEAAEAMREASRYFVDFNRLHRNAGKHIAGLLGVESALVTAGAAAALVQATAACMAGADPKKRLQLPQGAEKNEVIIMRSHRNPYDQAIRLAGAKFVEIGSAIETHPWELEGAMNSNTAAVAFFLQSEMLDASLRLPETIQIAHQFNVPVIVDAAAELPPKSNLWSIAQAGGDLVVFSGGKDIRGPQTSGLVVGRQDLIEAAAFHSAPNDGIARPMKAGKEIVAGLVKALEYYLEEDEDARFDYWDSLSLKLQQGLSKIPGLLVEPFVPSQPRVQPAVVPRLKVRLEKTARINIDGLVNELRTGDPPIAVDRSRDGIILNVHFVENEEAAVILSRFESIFSMDDPTRP